MSKYLEIYRFILKSFLVLITFFLFSINSIAKAQSIVVDQLIATVNGDAITKSDLVWALVLNPKTKQTDLTLNLPIVLEQVIDQRLLLSEANRLPNLDPTQIEISKTIAEVVKKFPSEALFYQRLEEVGLTGEILQKIFRERLLILKYVDFRFRAFAIITENEIQAYYEENVKSKLLTQNINPSDKPSDEERKLIEAILVEERVNIQIEQFLDSARQQADIVRLTSL
ncbi:MAG: SurA N-terminal domain-containing protein [Acidobacteria bacterium]|nr:SurA N-terminal domain-containing protein [Acidobacteriota bacterium]